MKHPKQKHARDKRDKYSSVTYKVNVHRKEIDGMCSDSEDDDPVNNEDSGDESNESEKEVFCDECRNRIRPESRLSMRKSKSDFTLGNHRNTPKKVISLYVIQDKENETSSSSSSSGKSSSSEEKCRKGRKHVPSKSLGPRKNEREKMTKTITVKKIIDDSYDDLSTPFKMIQQLLENERYENRSKKWNCLENETPLHDRSEKRYNSKRQDKKCKNPISQRPSSIHAINCKPNNVSNKRRPSSSKGGQRINISKCVQTKCIDLPLPTREKSRKRTRCKGCQTSHHQAVYNMQEMDRKQSPYYSTPANQIAAGHNTSSVFFSLPNQTNLDNHQRFLQNNCIQYGQSHHNLQQRSLEKTTSDISLNEHNQQEQFLQNSMYYDPNENKHDFQIYNSCPDEKQYQKRSLPNTDLSSCQNQALDGNVDLANHQTSDPVPYESNNASVDYVKTLEVHVDLGSRCKKAENSRPCWNLESQAKKIHSSFVGNNFDEDLKMMEQEFDDEFQQFAKRCGLRGDETRSRKVDKIPNKPKNKSKTRKDLAENEQCEASVVLNAADISKLAKMLENFTAQSTQTDC